MGGNMRPHGGAYAPPVISWHGDLTILTEGQGQSNALDGNSHVGPGVAASVLSSTGAGGGNGGGGTPGGGTPGGGTPGGGGGTPGGGGGGTPGGAGGGTPGGGGGGTPGGGGGG